MKDEDTMSIDEILALWAKDVDIDPTNLGGSALDIAKLHHKYYTILTKERMILRVLESELKQLKLAKQEFFIEGPSEETVAKGWKLPARGKILRADVNTYIEADKDIIQLTLKIGMAKEKVDMLMSILDNIHWRGQHLKTAVEWQKFISGS